MRGSAIAIALLLLSSTLYAQSAVPPLTARVDVQVVNVDVTVTDMDGKPVMNLTKDDFEIFEDGKPQKITNFYVFEGATPRETAGAGAAAAAAANKGEIPPEFRRKVLLLVDNNYIEVNERNIALNKIEQYVTSTFGAEWSIATIGTRAEILQPFTTDSKLIRAAFERVRHQPSYADQHRISRSILSEREQTMNEPLKEYDYSESVRFQAREQTFRNLMTMQATSRALTEMARAHSADVGKKYIILLTGGMERNTGFAAHERDRRDHELEELRTDIAKTIDEMVREANAASFTVHIINAAHKGMPAPQADVENRSSGLNINNLFRGNGGNEPIDVSDVDSTPLSLALGTGGMYLPSGDIVESVQRIDRQTANFYSLGYSPEHQGDHQYHRIKVSVKRRGLRVANRAGYFDLTAEDRLQEMLHTHAAVERNVGSLPVSIAVGEPRDSEKDMVVPVTAGLSMDKVTLLPRDDNYVGRVHIYLSVFDEAGKNIGFHHQMQEVTLPLNQLASSMEKMFHYTIKVHLRKGGKFNVMMTLRDELSNELGSATKEIGL